MTQHSTSAPDSVPTKSSSNQLLKSSISFFHIVLMVTAAAAPLVIVTTYVPISLSSGSGMATALTYAAVTIVLLIFTVGFVQMAKRVTCAGPFYTFTSQGLGKPLGLSAGMATLAAYSMITVATQGGFGFYASALVETYAHVSIAWYWYSIASLLLMFAISYFRVTLTARILGVLLVTEVLVVAFVALATIGQGGATGQVPEAFNPGEFSAAPALGIGFFLAFWSWIGFETTAIYGEETVDPKASVPRATYIAVTTLGIFYTIAAYAAIVGFGSDSPEQAGTLLDQYFFALADEYTFHFVRVGMDFLVVSGFFAASFAFHNNASRYFYSLGRDGILPSALGRTQATHKSPHIAAGTQTVIAIVAVCLFALGGADPILHVSTWLPIFCTLAIIVVQLLVSVAVIGYFNRIGRTGPSDYLKTLVAPAVGALAQVIIVVLLVDNLSFLAGSSGLVVTLIPIYVVVLVAAAAGYAFWLRRYRPDRFARIGELHDDELEELFVSE